MAAHLHIRDPRQFLDVLAQLRDTQGTIQTDGFPPVLAAADAMLKAGRVTLVYYGLAERAEFLITIRGPVSEVNQAVAAGHPAAITYQSETWALIRPRLEHKFKRDGST